MMKKLKLLIIILFVKFLAPTIIAQETIWFDANWQETIKDKSEYYRPPPKKIKNGYWIIDYYNSGQIQMEGYSTVSKVGEEKFDGLVVYYYKDGKPFHRANYKAGKLHGLRRVYYETGELKEQGKYNQGKREGIWKTFYKNGKIKEKGKYKDNIKSGIWKTYYKNTI